MKSVKSAMKHNRQPSALHTHAKDQENPENLPDENKNLKMKLWSISEVIKTHQEMIFLPLKWTNYLKLLLSVEEGVLKSIITYTNRK